MKYQELKKSYFRKYYNLQRSSNKQYFSTAKWSEEHSHLLLEEIVDGRLDNDRDISYKIIMWYIVGP